MSDRTAAEILRSPFPPEQIGHLPRGGFQVDYVGHADVTSRLLEADPEWSWEPQARDVDKDILAAAVATGNPDVVRQVLENAPPKFDADKNGHPVGLWIRLTVGGVTRPGFGSCPSAQADPEKVLIGDALRNAAMRFGVAVDLWAKGDRADPTRENATEVGGQAARHGRQQQQSRPAKPAKEPAPADPEVIAKWGDAIDGITIAEDADKIDADLREVFKAGKMSPATANAIRVSIKAKVASLGEVPAAPAAASPNGKSASGEKAAAGIAAQVMASVTEDELRNAWRLASTAQLLSASCAGLDGSKSTIGQLIDARLAEIKQSAETAA